LTLNPKFSMLKQIVVEEEEEDDDEETDNDDHCHLCSKGGRASS